ncbi:uncharacterized protein LTR77_000835 [Saxophila tyrrhenica]|uniref:FAD/NAD(P)-binding domain-containing protein n=1 Tax=Saxophila tyrrhenica TaxID=1690608 RepID=A0AAV9PPF8_9PEZI|nr:hypothetical protein LTR77_000835 [Saxophila tyrrhenica]
MSAIPNLYEGVDNTSNPDAIQQQLQNNKDAVQHFEYSQSNGTAPATNGVKTEEPWALHDTPVENQRPLKVIVIGAGYSGIYLGIRIPERLRNVDLVIYEKNAGVGGTWYENQYPGAACDIPSHSYQFSFNPKHDWSALYAPSWEIRDYLTTTAKKYGANRFIKLEHKVAGATWHQDEGKWHVRVEQPDGSMMEDTADVVISARGNLNNKMWPDIPGLWDKFKGEVMHSAAWNQNYDFGNKRVGVIGSGSSAIQIIPKLQAKKGAHLNCFIRNRTWISPPLGQAMQDKYGIQEFEFSPDQIKKFEEDPESWMHFRMDIEADANNIHAVTIKNSEMQKGAKKAFAAGMKERLAKKPEYYDYLKPGFSPGCRRLTPGPGFLEALVEDNVSFVRDRIERLEEKGVVTEDGALHEIDVLVCATGFYASTAPPFPVKGLGGETLDNHWSERATNYLSLATDGFPNYMMMLGPNGAIGEGSLTMMIESTGDYITKAVRKIQKENIRSMVVKPDRVKDFLQYCDTYFQGTVYSEECRSWYKKNGRGVSAGIVTGLWPGSTLHCIEALRSPRWEDYEYAYRAEPNGAPVNQMAWLGNGWGAKQTVEKPDMEALSFYITPMFQEREIGVPVEGRPEENKQYQIRPWSY